ncbi:serine/threonine protein kinase [Thermosporothrix hazakensis]|jgi:serine/threonine protein kinase|uniref:non-specific serine/threonine protein kinase n=1 Tax=Thermosporothrix hazakensis TaxID=644383 RepID=A0A326UBE4_THEHA|nr:serine/threonine-protein kinase [Thermosporothrix hazakensis]PZW30621.1 serine/threonine protein kinase [Thermosporothrix hazakensis]GCE49484.1 hypothetical protein KTH_43530 [Thermosporothrix hazakensis]
MAMYYLIDWQDKTIGRYRPIRLIGRGGMGEVWLAEDAALQRQVAIKIFPPVLAEDKSYLDAFTYEARAIASLEHPHILQVHDFGQQPLEDDEEQIVTYLVTPYLTGGTLRDLIYSEPPLTPEAGLRFLRQAAEAIDYAHSKHIIHRDIKPANMLLQDNLLFLADFGIAKLLNSATHRSQTHAGGGTPEYMAPEQAQGYAEFASDRYSLAIIAYHLFTGKLPFRGDNPFDVLLKQLHEAPPRPRQINPTIPLHVEAVLMKGLAKDPAQRPPSCVAFVEALTKAWHNPRMERTDPDATLLAPWSKRLSSANTAASRLFDIHARTQPTTDVPDSTTRDLLQETDTVTQHTRTLTQNLLDGSHQKLKRRTLLVGGATAAIVTGAGGFALFRWYSQRQSEVQPTPTPQPGPHHFIEGKQLLSLEKHLDEVREVKWSPDGNYLASAGLDKTVYAWNIRKAINTSSAKDITYQRWRATRAFYGNSLDWTADSSRLLFTCGENNEIDVVDPASDDDATQYGNAEPPAQDNIFATISYTKITANVQGDTFATDLGETNKLLLWHVAAPPKQKPKVLADDKLPSVLKHKYAITTTLLSWSRDGLWLAQQLSNFQVAIWDVKAGKVKHLLEPAERAKVYTKDETIFIFRQIMAWSPTQKTKLALCNLDTIEIWDALTRKVEQRLLTDDYFAFHPPDKENNLGFKLLPQVASLCWSPNGRYIAACYMWSNRVHIWDLADPKPRMKDGYRLPTMLFGKEHGHNSTILDLNWSPDGKYLATAGADKTIRIWQVDATP